MYNNAIMFFYFFCYSSLLLLQIGDLAASNIFGELALLYLYWREFLLAKHE